MPKPKTLYQPGSPIGFVECKYVFFGEWYECIHGCYGSYEPHEALRSPGFQRLARAAVDLEVEPLALGAGHQEAVVDAHGAVLTVGRRAIMGCNGVIISAGPNTDVRRTLSFRIGDHDSLLWLGASTPYLRPWTLQEWVGRDSKLKAHA